MLDKTLKVNKKGRNQKMCQMRMDKDMTIYQLADYFGITKQRVQQILERDLDNYLKSRKKLLD